MTRSADSTVMKSVWTSLALCVACLGLSSCGSSDLDDSRVRFLLGTQPVRLDGEQVSLNFDQLNCGVKAELWEIQELGPDRSVARITPKGREVTKFDDDIQVGEMRLPYTQIRGEFRLAVNKINEIKEEGKDTKIVDVKAGPVIDHACFGDKNPPYLLGVRKGTFTLEFDPRIQFTLDGDWKFDRILH